MPFLTGVGKSCLITQFLGWGFVEAYDPTLEGAYPLNTVALGSRSLNAHLDEYRKQTIIDDEIVSLNILDTAGQSDYQ